MRRQFATFFLLAVFMQFMETGCGRLRFATRTLVNRDAASPSNTDVRHLDANDASMLDVADANGRADVAASLDASQDLAVPPDVTGGADAQHDVMTTVDARAESFDAGGDSSNTGVDSSPAFDAPPEVPDSSFDASEARIDVRDAGVRDDAPPASLRIRSSSGTVEVLDTERGAGGVTLISGRAVGDLIVGGTTYPGAGLMDGFAIVLAPDGGVRAVRTIGGAGNDLVRAVALDPAGNLFLGGTFEGTVDFGGSSRTATSAWGDGYVASYDSAGVLRFVFMFGDTSGPSAFAPDNLVLDLDIAQDGTVLVAGAFRGSIDFGGGLVVGGAARNTLMLALESNGAFRWVRPFGVAAYNVAMAVASVGTSATFTGYYEASPDIGDGAWPQRGIQDTFVARLDLTTGATIWTRNWGTGGFDWPLDIGSDATGAVVVAGFVEGAVDLGSGPLPRPGGRDAFLVKLGADGGTQWAIVSGSSDCDLFRGVDIDPLGNVLAAGRFGVMPSTYAVDGVVVAPFARSSPQAIGVRVSSSGTFLGHSAIPGETGRALHDGAQIQYVTGVGTPVTCNITSTASAVDVGVMTP